MTGCPTACRSYLPSVPIDYGDGQPIRYSREFRTVWSVGPDNLTITATDQKVDFFEIVYRLDFAAPEADTTTVETGSDGGAR